MIQSLLSPDGLHHTLAKLALLRAFKAARDVDDAPGSPQMDALLRAEAVWAQIRYAA